jgi:glycosyltransferase involved in cell wall biosynthesis
MMAPIPSRGEQMPLVSVIMIFLNAERFMEEAIESVRSQTLNDWELVLVNDGSQDGSAMIAQRYAAADPERIRLFQHPGGSNRGTGPSRNLGLLRARGRYICFLDSDDVFEPLRLERTVSLLESDPELGVVISAELYWRSWQAPEHVYSRLLRKPDQVLRPNGPLSRAILPPALISSTLATPGAAMPAPCSVTFRRLDMNLAFVPDEFVSQYEDQVLMTRLLLERSAVVLPECLSRYRQHADSLTHRAERRGDYVPGRPHEARTQFLRWLRDYLDQLDIDEPILTAAVDAELSSAAAESLRTPRRIQRYSLQRLALIAANLLLPRAVAGALIHNYLRREQLRVDKKVAMLVEKITAAGPRARPEKLKARSGGES